MEIDPAALSRSSAADAPPLASTVTPSLSTKALPSGKDSAGQPRAGKGGGGGAATAAAAAVPTAPRVDLEPYYAELKAAIGDAWSDYKDAVSQFVIGYRNQTELSSRIEGLLRDPHLENVHNQLICGLYANLSRDAPDTLVATWVSANDKPIAAAKPPTGDAADQRLKGEVMHLPPRLRGRIKAIRDEPRKPITETLIGQAQALTLHPVHDSHQSSLTSTETPTSGNATGINRDLEIRRRYQQPLISEVRDVPASAALNDRILPICYQEGLHAGVGNSELCAELVSTALEVFMKDLLTTIVSRTRCDAPVSGPRPDPAASPHLGSAPSQSVETVYGAGLDRTGLGIMTAGYKKRLRDEEALWRRGEIKRSEGGLLPIEIQSLQEADRGKGAVGDLRLAMEADDAWIRALAPWQAERIVIDCDYRAGEERSVDEDGAGRKMKGFAASVVTSTLSNGSTTNGVNGVNGRHQHAAGTADRMDIDDEESGWAGAREADRVVLGSLLESCLNFE